MNPTIDDPQRIHVVLCVLFQNSNFIYNDTASLPSSGDDILSTQTIPLIAGNMSFRTSVCRSMHRNTHGHATRNLIFLDRRTAPAGPDVDNDQGREDDTNGDVHVADPRTPRIRSCVIQSEGGCDEQTVRD